MPLVIFLLLQIADVLSTLACMHYGGQEGNPVARWLMAQGRTPLAGMIALKIMAAVVGCLLWDLKKYTALIILDYMFALIVLWNLLILSFLMRA